MFFWLGNYNSSYLFWVTEFGIWESSENLHLYYKLRQSYGDLRELSAAPGHYFMSYEVADLVSYVDLAIQFGWSGHLLCEGFQHRAWISHDEWMLIDAPAERTSILRGLEAMSLKYELPQASPDRE